MLTGTWASSFGATDFRGGLLTFTDRGSSSMEGASFFGYCSFFGEDFFFRGGDSFFSKLSTAFLTGVLVDFNDGDSSVFDSITEDDSFLLEEVRC